MNNVWTIEDMREFARIKEGFCFSTKYVNRETKLHFGCKEGHDWWTIPYIVIKGGWCRRCANIKRGLARRDTIEDMRELAKLRGIECLSTAYVNQKIKLHWKCSFGHEWWTAPHSIKYRNGGCPECFSSIGENICRQYFEALFGKPFPKTRPAWLVNSKRNRQELDGYCEELKLAFEYNGQQHYNYENAR